MYRMLHGFKCLIWFVVFMPMMIFASEISGRLPPDGFMIVPNDTTYGAARDAFVTLLNRAKNKIDLSMYQLKDQGMIDALVRASKRGVKVRVVTEKNPYKHSYNQEKNNQGGVQQLEKIGIEVKGLAPRFLKNHPKAQAHHKILIVDDKYVVVMTCNWDTATLASTRDFALIIDKHKNPVEFQDINNIFAADWQNKIVVCKSKALIVGPDHQREKFIQLFSRAKHHIEIYQQSYNDAKIAKVLESLCRQGIKVRLIMMPFPFDGKIDGNASFQESLIRAGGEVHLVRSRYIHAKAIVIDGKMAYIGSCNFYPPSLEFNREVGVVTTNPSVIKRLQEVFNRDWVDNEVKLIMG